MSSFKSTLSGAGRAFLAAFGSTLLLLATGVLTAPDVATAQVVAVAALIASVSAGVKALVSWVPLLSFRSLLPQPLAAWVDAFVQGFVGALLVGLANWLDAGDVSNYNTALTAIFVGALVAGVRVLQGLLTEGEYPLLEKGF
ncbi:MAG: hypothetical protein QXU32_02520 [Nitrososphaerales archaeon]